MLLYRHQGVFIQVEAQRIEELLGHTLMQRKLRLLVQTAEYWRVTLSCNVWVESDEGQQVEIELRLPSQDGQNLIHVSLKIKHS